MEGQDLRRSPRVPMCVRVGASGEGVGSLIALGYVRDISRHGMYVDFKLTAATTTPTVEHGALLRLKFCVPGSSDPIEVSGKVKRRDFANDQTLGLGIEFEELDVVAESIIHRFLNDALQEPESDLKSNPPGLERQA